MADFPDVYSWIKLVNRTTGKAVPSGTSFYNSTDVVVRYAVANDSHKPAGPLTVVGHLWKNGVDIQLSGKPVVPAQQITVGPNQVWRAEYEVQDTATLSDTFEAKLLADVGNFVDEEDEKNNKASATFSVVAVPK